MSSADKNGVTIWEKWYEAIDSYTKGSDADFGRMVRVLLEYGLYDKDITQTEIEKLFLSMVAGVLSKSKTLHANPGRPKKKAEVELEEIAEETESENFKKPTVEEIKEYCKKEKIENVEAENFIDYYESNGWKVGRNKMKDWKRTVKRWSRNQKSPPPAKETSQSTLHRITSSMAL